MSSLDAAQTAAPTVASDVSAVLEKQGPLILVVEDSKTQAARLRYLLQRNGYRVEVAPDGQSALEFIAGQKPNLVLSDIVMPVMDGYEMCRQLKNRAEMADVNVILLTSLWDASDIVKGLQSGADYYLTKPYEDEYLLSTLKNALAQPAPTNPEEPEIEINLNEQSYLISSTRLQMLHLLLSTYGNAVQQNRQLVESQRELNLVNSRLVAQQAQIEQQGRELRETNARLLNQATRDSLTGLRNHRALQERLHEELARHWRGKEPLSLVLLDVDNFKGFNDSFGHPAGDEVLRNIAKFMEGEARTSDLVARYGGEEFVILLPETDVEESQIVAERVRCAIEAGPWRERAVTASLGIATIKGSSFESNDEINQIAGLLLARADEALYSSKANGRNRVTHYEAIADFG